MNGYGPSIWPGLAERLDRLRRSGPMNSPCASLLDPYELTVFPDGRAIIKGTTDIGIARSLYARYVGA